MNPKTMQIRGQLTRRGDQSGLADYRVEVWMRRRTQEMLVGKTHSDGRGGFLMEIERATVKDEVGGRQMELFIRVYDGENLLHTTAAQPARQWAARNQPVRIELSPVNFPGTQPDLPTPEDETLPEPEIGFEPFPHNEPGDFPQNEPEPDGQVLLITGEVVQPDGEPLPNYRVRAYDRGLCEWRSLGEATTNEAGKYRISYHREQLQGWGKPRADLKVRVFAPGKLDEAVAASPLYIQAKPHEQIDFSIGKQPYRGASEFTRLGRALAAVGGEVGKLACASVEDIFLIAKRSAQPAAHVAYFVKAARWAADLDLPAALFYGLFRRNLPTGRSALFARPLPALWRALQQAKQRNLINLALNEALKERLVQVQSAYLLAVEHPYQQLLATTSLTPQQNSRFTQYLQAGSKGGADFWDGLNAAGDFRPEQITELQGMFELQILTGDNPSLTAHLRSQRKVHQPRQTALFSVADWEQDVAAAGVEIPDEILAGYAEQTRQQGYARMLFATAERRFPTTSLVAQLGRSQTWKEKNLLDALQKVPEFGFESGRVTALLGLHPEILAYFPDAEQGRLDLLRLEQLFHLTPEGAKAVAVEALWQVGLKSAPQIARAGRRSLRRKLAQALPRGVVDRVYQNALQITATSLAVYLEYQPRLNTPNTYALQGKILRADSAPSSTRRALAKTSAELPEWEELFGSAGACDVPHWASVLSPAAYLVEMLDYLQRAVDSDGKDGLEHLLERRPDLGSLQLTQANTETTLPYIDLVIETMEQITAAGPGNTEIPDTGFGQTTWESELLQASPERVEPAAYEPLRQAIYPFKTLPFDLWLAEGRRYLTEMRISRRALMEALPRQANVTEADLAGEALGMSTRERLIIVAPDGREQSVALAWGLEPNNPRVLSRLSEVETLITQADCTYADFLRLLNTRFLNPNRFLTIVFNGDECDLNKAVLGRSDGAVLAPSDLLAFLNRTHRFIRLQRRLGWNEYELDQFITRLKFNDFNSPAFLESMVALRDLADAWRLSISDLCSLWADLDTFAYEAETLSQYEAIFLDPAQFPASHSGTGADLRNAVFALRPDRTDLALTVASDPNLSRNLAEPDGVEPPGYVLHSEYAAYIQAATRLTSADLLLLAANVLPKDTNGNVLLNLANLSSIYRLALLGRALGVTLLDALRLLKLMGIAPGKFDTVPLKPVQTTVIWQAAETVASREWSLEELAYLLLHEPETLAACQPAAEEVAALLVEISAGYSGIADTPGAIQRARLDPATRSQVAQVLGAALGLAGELVEELVFSQEPAVGQAIVDHAILAANPALTSLPAPAREFASLYESLHKFALAWQPLGFEQADLGFVLKQGTALGWCDLAALPVAPRATAGFGGWQRLMAAAEVNTAHFLPGQSLCALLAAAEAATLDREAFLAQTSIWSGWSLADLTYLADSTGFNWTYPDDFRSEQWLVALDQIFGLIQPAGCSAAQAHTWCGQTVDYNQAQAIKHTLKQAYDATAWLKVLAGMQDELRSLRREALLGHLLQRLGTKDTTAFYSHYLLDPEMDPCMLTTRLVLAHTTVQLFAQRIALNLEPTLSFSSADVEGLVWRKNYRVWEAARKVFLYPENYMLPELRDDRSVFFKELEDSLLQDEVTQENAEEKFRDYLLKLDQVSRLEMMALYQDDDTKTLHVFGRTKDIPHTYFYRRWENQAHWTPWERVNLDIETDHLIPVVYNGRLYLFWPEFKVTFNENYTIGTENSLTADEIEQLRDQIDDLERQIKEIDEQLAVLYNLPKPTEVIDDLELEKNTLEIELVNKENELNAALEAPPPQDRYLIELGMAWSDYRLGGWSARVLSEEKAYYSTNATIGRHYFTGWVSSSYELKIAIRTNNTGIGATGQPDHYGYFYFDDCQGKLQFSGEAPIDTPQGEVAVTGALQDEQGLVWGSPTWSVEFLELLLDGGDTARKLLTSGGKLIYAHQYGLGGSETAPFFFTDYERTYFVRPTVGFALVSDRLVLDGIELSGSNASLALTPNGRANGVVNGTAVSRAGTNLEHHYSQDSALIIDRSVELDSYTGLTGLVDRVGGILDEDTVIVAHNTEIADETRYGFTRFYNPYSCTFLRQLARLGVAGLLHPDPEEGSADSTNLYRQLTPLETFDFNAHYAPEYWVSTNYPKDEIDFDPDSPWGSYNYEVFFHIPMLIAIRLLENQRFAEAQQWFQFIFDPNNQDGKAPERFWLVRPFYEAQGKTATETTRELMELLEQGDYQLEQQVQAWLEDPFNPYLIGRLRTAAYMRHTFMKYLDCLIAEADLLFTQDTMESVSQATQLYLLAGELLGEKPSVLPTQETVSLTPSQLLGRVSLPLGFELPPDPLDGLSSWLPTNLPGRPTSPAPYTPHTGQTVTIQLELASWATLWQFGMPYNEQLYGYWDVVADRLFKIRHCQNISGVKRVLPAYQPPIDPMLLVRAAAAGLELASVLNSLNAPRPNYRFSHLLQHAQDFCNEVRSLGAALLTALEKQDAEEMSLLRAEHAVNLLDTSRVIKQKQIDEAKEQLALQNKVRESGEARRAYYAELIAGGLLPQEARQLEQMALANAVQLLTQGNEQLATVLYAFPQVILPVGSEFGGLQLGQAAQAAARAVGLIGINHSYQANRAAVEGGNKRRLQEWRFQHDLVQKELAQIEKQIVAAEIRQQIAEHDLENLDKQIEQEQGVEEFLKLKFSNQALYSWMVSKLSGLYFQAYQAAYQQARQAERAFQQELGLAASAATYIQPTYYDSLKKGLLAGEQLAYDLKRLQAAYLEQNSREHELTRHISLRQLNPLALLALKAGGACQVSIPEWLYDLTNPGHYLRRIKHVSMSIPAISGPYSSVNCTLTLLGSSVRTSALLENGGYSRQTGDDLRFSDYPGGFEAIVTSSGSNDSGLFEPNLRDERFLPFEGAGAVSEWRLELPAAFRQFDYNTISDVILHIRYTARSGGDALRDAAVAELAALVESASSSQLALLVSLKSDTPTEWAQFVSGSGDFSLTLRREFFPYFTTGRELSLEDMQLCAIVDGQVETSTPSGVNLGNLSAALNDSGAGTLTLPEDGVVLVRQGSAAVFLVVTYTLGA